MLSILWDKNSGRRNNFIFYQLLLFPFIALLLVTWILADYLKTRKLVRSDRNVVRNEAEKERKKKGKQCVCGCWKIENWRLIENWSKDEKQCERHQQNWKDSFLRNVNFLIVCHRWKIKWYEEYVLVWGFSPILFMHEEIWEPLWQHSKRNWSKENVFAYAFVFENNFRHNSSIE